MREPKQQVGQKLYVQDSFYKTLALRRGMTDAQVAKRSRRLYRACLKVGVHKNKIHLLRLDNPFIYPHAWKFLVRTSLRDVRLRPEGAK